MPDHHRPSCRPLVSRAVCDVPACNYADTIDGHRSAVRRELLRRDLRRGVPPTPVPCDRPGCTSCGDHGREPLDPDAADVAVEGHVSDRIAVLYLRGLIEINDVSECELCGARMPEFADRLSSPGLIADGRCPHYYFAGADGLAEGAR